MYFLKVLATHLWSHVEPVYFFYFKVLIGRTKSVLSSTTDCSFKFLLLLINQALHFLNKLVQFTPPVVHFGLSTELTGSLAFVVNISGGLPKLAASLIGQIAQDFQTIHGSQEYIQAGWLLDHLKQV